MGKDTDLAVRDIVARNLRLLYEERRFESIQAMADAIDISRGALSNYLNGSRTVGLDILLKARKHLSVSIDWLVTNQAPPRFHNWPVAGEAGSRSIGRAPQAQGPPTNAQSAALSRGARSGSGN